MQPAANDTQYRDRLSPVQKTGYALGIHGIMYFWYAANLYLFYFYTDVVGLTPSQTGTIFLLSLLWDGATDPVMGTITDRLVARGWRYRPLVLIGGIPFCASFIAIFYVPGSVDAFIYCLVANLMFRLFFTMTYIPYTSMLTRITEDSRERARIGGYKTIMIGFSKLPVSFLVLPMVALLGAGNEAQGFLGTMSIVALLAALAFLGFFVLTPEEFEIREKLSGSGHTLREVLAFFRGNSQFWVVMLGLFLGSGSFGIIMQSLIYYYKYNLAEPGAAKIAFTAIAIGSLVGVPIWMRLLRVMSSRMVWFCGCCVAVGALLTIYLLPQPGIWAVAVLIGIASAGIYGFIMTYLPMTADTVDFGERSSGHRIEAFSFGFMSLANKLSIGTAGWLLGLLQTRVGFEPNTDLSAATLQGLKGIMTLAPLIGLGLSALVILIYRIDADFHRELLTEVRRRRTDPA